MRGYVCRSDNHVELEDDCKTFLGNLSRECRPEDVRQWLSDNGYQLVIPCKMVIRGDLVDVVGWMLSREGAGFPP